MAHGADLYVSPVGNDAWSGKIAAPNAGKTDGPFLTLGRAREAARAAGPGTTVHLRGGDYPLAGSFELSVADSGTKGKPVTYRNFGKEVPRLTLGIDVTDRLAPVTDAAVRGRLQAAARDRVRELDLGAMGVAHGGPFPDLFDGGGGILEIYHDGRRLPMARWPKSGYVTMARVVSGSSQVNAGAGAPPIFVYRDDRHAAWDVAGGVWMAGFWRVPWTIQAVRVKAIDTRAKTVELAARVPGGIGSKYAKAQGSGQEPYYVLNVLEEVDRPGDWCIDFGARKLYALPPEGRRGRFVIADMADPMVRVAGASNLVLRGILFDISLGGGVAMEDCSDCAVSSCVFRNLGSTAVQVAGGTRVTVSGCDMHDLAEGGVSVSGGDRATLAPCGHVVRNNDIHRYGILKRTYAPGIDVGFGRYAKDWRPPVGVTVANNRIHDAPHAGILYGGNDNVIEYNECYNLALDSHDVGALYSVMDWTSYGNIVRGNFIHDSPNANGVYLDDGDSGDLIEGNVIARVSVGVFIGGGHDNVARDNIMVECKKSALHIDSRGTSRGYDLSHGILSNRLASVPYDGALWRDRYPAMPGILKNPELPTGNVFERNAAVRCPKVMNQSGKPEHFRDLVNRGNEAFQGDPGFANEKAMDYRLRPGNKIGGRIKGFRAPAIERAGLVVDADRAAIPPRETPGAGRRIDFDSTVDLDATNRQRPR